MSLRITEKKEKKEIEETPEWSADMEQRQREKTRRKAHFDWETRIVEKPLESFNGVRW